MNEIPQSAIGKDIQITYTSGRYKRIHRIVDVYKNIVIDQAGNKHHIQLDNVAQIFEPKSSKFELKKLNRKKMKDTQDDFEDLECFDKDDKEYINGIERQ